jgi:RHS repeat-associated protein
LTGVGTTPYQLDAAGNLTQAGDRGFNYTLSGRLRMSLVNGGFTGYYRYAHTGLRLQKYTWATGWRVFHYSADGKLLAETRDTGALVRAYVWDDDTPVAQIDRDPVTGQETLSYLHTDHLQTPRLATDGQRQVVWRWEGEAFGEAAPSGSITVNLRFPGQYFDAETGLHYNWHRYYDPRVGRYITSDPIGLDGGLNTYSYVTNNPLRYTDPRGLASELALGSCVGGPNPICIGAVVVNACKWLAIGGTAAVTISLSGDTKNCGGDKQNGSCDDEDEEDDDCRKGLEEMIKLHKSISDAMAVGGFMSSRIREYNQLAARLCKACPSICRSIPRF